MISVGKWIRQHKFGSFAVLALVVVVAAPDRGESGLLGWLPQGSADEAAPPVAAPAVVGPVVAPAAPRAVKPSSDVPEGFYEDAADGDDDSSGAAIDDDDAQVDIQPDVQPDTDVGPAEDAPQ
ncbi:MAG: hypothetical protein RLZZ08_1790 [Pseudomonadota bacterium]|jgi:hypothetical protein